MPGVPHAAAHEDGRAIAHYSRLLLLLHGQRISSVGLLVYLQSVHALQR